jgi:hypothetical protein
VVRVVGKARLIDRVQRRLMVEINCLTGNFTGAPSILNGGAKTRHSCELPICRDLSGPCPAFCLSSRKLILE